MIEKGKTYVVMGLLNAESLAFVIGETIRKLGGKVIYTVLNERMKRMFLDRSRELTEEQREALNIRYCDVTVEVEVHHLFEDLGEIAGVVHSIAFANPRTLLGRELHTNAFDDIRQSFHISAVSLATVTYHAQKVMPKGGSIVALTFDTKHVYPHYNWMGVNKAALEALVRALARRHGRQLLRINAVSAGPVETKAAKAIHGFSALEHLWADYSPIPWDPIGDKQEIANMTAFLLGDYAKKITGQVIHVDGGASIMGGRLMPHEFEAPAAAPLGPEHAEGAAAKPAPATPA